MIDALPVAHEHVSDELWTSLKGRVIASGARTGQLVDELDAERELNELINVYLPLLATHSNLSPSARVDNAWHVFILHMRAYEDYCVARFGRVIYHTPAPLGTAGHGARYARDFMDEHGIAYDAELWAFERCAECCGD